MDLGQGHEAFEMFEAQTHVYKHCYYYVNSMAIKCAIQLGIPDSVHNHHKPITISELVSSLHVHPTKSSYLQRLMRMLVHSGFFSTAKDNEEEGFVITPVSKLLLKENVNSLSPFVQAMLDPVLTVPWLSLGDWFKGNDMISPFETVKFLNEGIGGDYETVSLIVKYHKEIFQGLDSLVDVGRGNLGRAIVEESADMKCTVLLDLQSVIDNNRFMPSADAIILESVLHNYEDEDCIKILKQCRLAITSKGGKGGKVIIIDILIVEQVDNDDENNKEVTVTKLYVDMAMMLISKGRERNEKDFEKLFLEAGFSHYKITPFVGLRSLIEVYP